MRRFNQNTSVAALELQQLAIDYWREIDFNDGHNGAEFYTQHCVIELGGTRYEGHEGLKQFFALRHTMNSKEKDGVRTTRHCPLNIQIDIHNTNTATLNFLVVSYSGGGQPPITGHATPNLISDVCFECERTPDSPWKIRKFSGDAVFLGS